MWSFYLNKKRKNDSLSDASFAMELLKQSLAAILE